MITSYHLDLAACGAGSSDVMRERKELLHTPTPTSYCSSSSIVATTTSSFIHVVKKLERGRTDKVRSAVIDTPQIRTYVAPCALSHLRNL